MTNYDLPEEVRVSCDGAVRVVTLNRPSQLNACSEHMHRGLTRVWGMLTDDRDARSVVLTGAGAAFSAGGDFGWLTQINQEESRQDAAAA